MKASKLIETIQTIINLEGHDLEIVYAVRLGEEGKVIKSIGYNEKSITLSDEENYMDGDE